MGYFVKNRGSGREPTGTIVPNGPTSERPLTPLNGNLRFNTTTLVMEYFNGTEFVPIITPGNVTIIVDNFTGNNITATFIMSQDELDANQILVFVGGVYQSPGSTYNVTGTQLAFFSPPPLNTDIRVVHNIGKIG